MIFLRYLETYTNDTEAYISNSGEYAGLVVEKSNCKIFLFIDDFLLWYLVQPEDDQYDEGEGGDQLLPDLPLGGVKGESLKVWKFIRAAIEWDRVLSTWAESSLKVWKFIGAVI